MTSNTSEMPVWYIAKLNLELHAPQGLLQPGDTVYFTPSVNPESIIVFDGVKRYCNLSRRKLQNFLGVNPEADGHWKKDRNPIGTANRYMNAVMRYQEEQAEHEED